MQAVAAGIVVAVVTASAVFGRLVAWACASGEEAPGSFEAELCDALDGLGSPAWWAAVLWPAALFGASQLSRALRANAFLVAVGVSALTIALWAVLGVVVIDVG
jgi:hypothetical protein